MKIGELSKATGVQVGTIRFYERKKLLRLPGERLRATAPTRSRSEWYNHPVEIIVKNPDILGGTPVFRGTRVPVQVLFDYLEGGETLEDFLEGFPTV